MIMGERATIAVGSREIGRFPLEFCREYPKVGKISFHLAQNHPTVIQNLPTQKHNTKQNNLGGGGFIFFKCSSLFGDDSHLTNVFQMGWFNHQLATHPTKLRTISTWKRNPSKSQFPLPLH